MKKTLLLIVPPFVIFFVIFGGAFFILSQKACDYAMSFHPQKLVAFNHKAHIEEYDAEDCETCHSYYDDGRFKGIPTAGDCRECHDGESAEEIEAMKKFKDNEKPWEAYAKQPDLVYFSHKVVANSPKETPCSSCHGDKANSKTTGKIKGKMLMGECMRCHTARKISNKCAVCHD